eukprot:TRINITY_DN4442_c0_g2_i1.p1 TRINITY_DN4442_c0_g2~~TRINITY_DN4442_c0_g2_i1.p1  ORF type:complete len:415 (+),score=49.72 TRINITY_DN4442_c0_g2_i1:165-1409(+)
MGSSENIDVLQTRPAERGSAQIAFGSLKSCAALGTLLLGLCSGLSGRRRSLRDKEASTLSTERDQDSAGSPETQGDTTPGSPAERSPSGATRRKPLLTRALTRVAAGHAGDVTKEVTDDGVTSTGFVLKKKDPVEEANYEKLFKNFGDATVDADPMQRWVPRYAGVTKDEEGQDYLRLQNMTAHDYRGAFVLDCKIGVRTFSEKEARNKKEREDLYWKAFALAEEDLTEEENKRKAITKFRWMNIHDSHTTTICEGFRVDGCVGATRIPQKELQKNKKRTDVVRFLHEDFMSLVCLDGESPASVEDSVPYKIATGFRDQLTEMRSDLERSSFFMTHEMIGASLLLVANKTGKTRARIIDLAKTFRIPDGLDSFNHRRPWALANHEDGWLFGLDNMIEVWSEVVDVILADWSASE